MRQNLGHALIVEDDLLLNRIFNDMAIEMGFSVTAADNAEAARDALSDRNYAVIVTDLELRGDHQGGLTLANEIIQVRPDVRVIIVSGHPKPTDMDPEIGFLEKPFTLAQLQGALTA